jgi:hypothetical protein
VESSIGRWCGGADEVVVVVRYCICKCKAGEGAEGPKSEIEPLGLNFRHAVENGDGEWWGEVVQWCG